MNEWTLAAIAGALLLVVCVANQRGELLASSDEAVPIEGSEDDGALELELGQAGGFLDRSLALVDPLTYLPTMTDDSTASMNEAAFLRTIRYAEGTAGPDGYRTLFGGRLFDGFEDHPRRAVQFTDRQGRTLWTSAAGAYQFMAVSMLPSGRSTTVNTWDRMRAKLGLVDFSPASQDAAALGLIDEAGALNDVRAGRFEQAIAKVKRIWASLPGAGYSQGERSIGSLRIAYENAGGTFA